MAAEELNRPPSVPPYAEMIFAAIDALKEKDGSNTSSISNYIESTCGSLPEDHDNILADQLNKLVETGELLLSNNNYIRPDSATPAKRGRGRPPKAKDPALAPAPVRTEAESPAPATAGSEGKRGRGRPKKYPNAPPSAKKVKTATVSSPSSSTGRPRGRPRKVQPEHASVEAN